MADEEHGPSERQHCHSAAPVLRQVRLRAVEGWYVLCPPPLPHTWPVILPVCGEPSYHTKGLALARCLVLCGSHKEGLPELNGKGCPNSGIAMSSKADLCWLSGARGSSGQVPSTGDQPPAFASQVCSLCISAFLPQ